MIHLILDSRYEEPRSLSVLFVKRSNSFIYHHFLEFIFSRVVRHWYCFVFCFMILNYKNLSSAYLPFPRRQILDSSKLKEFAEDNLRFGENGSEFSNKVENTVGKGGIACYEQFLLFLQCFPETCTADT